MATKSRVALLGSARKPFEGAKAAGVIDPAQQMEVTVRLQGRDEVSDQALMEMGSKPPARRKVMSRDEFNQKFGADPDDLARVEAFAHQYGLAVTHSSVSQRIVRLKGTAGNFSEAFGVKLKHYKKGRSVSYRGRVGPIYIPKDLENVIAGVHGLDNRPVAKPHIRAMQPMATMNRKGKKKGAKPKNSPDGTLSTLEVSQLYNFPSGLSGKGQTIALIELNDIDNAGNPTGTGYSTSDLSAYFSGLGISEPTVVPVSVDGGSNVPGPDPNADGEVTLDIEVAGAVAPDATIAVYFAPNTTNGFIDALNTAVHDSQHQPSVVSISWGGAEDPGGVVDDQFVQGLHQALKDAATLGVTVCCAAGDDGSADMGDGSNGGPTWDGQPHVDFPASSPFALACGGTKLEGSNGTVDSEVVWNEGRRGGASGGGVSNVFPMPDYQSGAGVPNSPAKKAGRGVPDLAGNADPFTGYQVVVGGQSTAIGGTSAVAPLMAGLIARINQSLAAKSATVGFVNPLLYGTAANAFRDITTGNNDIEKNLNGTYSAGPGWDACTGQGVPDGQKLLDKLAA
jgi:kumamolisin